MKTKTLMVGLAIGVSAAACKFLVQQVVPYVERWSSGLPKSQGSLDGGLQNGDWVFSYESGKPRAKGRYTNDRQIGPWTYYYENGVVERTGSYDDRGLRSGEWTLQYQDQTPQARGSYVADFEDGPWQFFRPDGGLERTGQFDAGKLSGPWTYYYPGGKPRAEGVYHRGARIGLWRVWSEAGLESSQDFGSKPGVSVVREAWPNGRLRRTGVQQNGAPVGRWTCWHDNGQLRFCCGLVDGKANGVFEARDAQGAVIAQGLLQNGAFVSGTAVDAGGQSRDLAAGPLPPPTANPWAAADALAALAPEARLALHVVEAASTIDATAVAAVPAPSMAPATTPDASPAPQVAPVVTAIEAEPARAPAPAQPNLSVKQRQEMSEYVKQYAEGTSPTAAALFDKYRPDPSKPRSAQQGERTEWYGKPLPFDLMKGVDGTELDVRQFRGKKRVMIVVLRGFLGEVCCYCIAQTKALAQSRERLEQLGIEVLVVYPGPQENQASFQKAYRMTFDEETPPYRVFYDADLQLVASLGVDGDLASPSTLILDQQGLIQYFYKGEHRADRPAAKKLLQKIEEMK